MKKDIRRLIILIEVLGLALQGYAIYRFYFESETHIAREEGKEETFLVTGGEETYEVTLDVTGETPDKKQRAKAIKKAKKEIDETFLKENRSRSEITGSVTMKEKYAEGMVNAVWEVTPSRVFKRDGTLRYDEVKGDMVVTVCATLQCEDDVELYSFPVKVKKPSMYTKEGFLYLVSSVFKTEDEKSEEKEVKLPTEVEGMSLKWSRPMDYTGLQICLLGIAGVMIFRFGTEFDEKKEKEKKKEAYLKDYPDIVSALTLYVGAGMSVRNAFERMGEAYLVQRKTRNIKEKPAYENMIRMNRALKDGQMEHKVYEDFGRSCLHPVYTKLALMLNQNSRKGNRELLAQLEREEQNLYEQRQRQLKIAGELTSTKLLIPMGGLLAMVLIVIIVPAFSGMRM
ncbi:MAG: type II secretion system F family protein [Lachnospiraceae bacterium]|nr:type II secretion system F family protein [Lachnospiraceae bacterium]